MYKEDNGVYYINRKFTFHTLPLTFSETGPDGCHIAETINKYTRIFWEKYFYGERHLGNLGAEKILYYFEFMT
jgi:hypothetical protein